MTEIEKLPIYLKVYLKFDFQEFWNEALDPRDYEKNFSDYIKEDEMNKLTKDKIHFGRYIGIFTGKDAENFVLSNSKSNSTSDLSIQEYALRKAISNMITRNPLIEEKENLIESIKNKQLKYVIGKYIGNDADEDITVDVTMKKNNKFETKTGVPLQKFLIEKAIEEYNNSLEFKKSGEQQIDQNPENVTIKMICVMKSKFTAKAFSKCNIPKYLKNFSYEVYAEVFKIDLKGIEDTYVYSAIFEPKPKNFLK